MVFALPMLLIRESYTLAQVLELLKVELEHSMALSGCCNLGAITKDLLIGPGGYGCQSKL